GGGNGTHPIDVTAAVDRKIAALMCHVSQHADPQRTGWMVREWMANAAKQFGLPDGAYAETFRVVDTRYLRSSSPSISTRVNTVNTVQQGESTCLKQSSSPPLGAR